MGETMNASIVLKLCIALIICCTGPALADQGEDEPGKGRKNHPAGQYRHDNDPGTYFHRHGCARLNIPEGHYPPPGECRIWYPGRPPGHQPPPGECSRLRSQVPPGAWLISHPEDEPEHVQVTVYDERRPGSILVTGEFEIDTGVFLRIVVNK